VQAGGLTIRLPGGTREGEQLRVIGAGERGWYGGAPGDLLLTVQGPPTGYQDLGTSLFDRLFSSAMATMPDPRGRYRWQ
jgi:DnaJ-class molecular chaperone